MEDMNFPSFKEFLEFMWNLGWVTRLARVCEREKDCWAVPFGPFRESQRPRGRSSWPAAPSMILSLELLYMLVSQIGRILNMKIEKCGLSMDRKMWIIDNVVYEVIFLF